MTMTKRTYSSAPTMTDDDVIWFSRNGYWILEGVVPDEINRRAMDYLDAHPISEPSGILEEDWFIENVIVNPAAAGAVRSLLGDNFTLPVLMSNHRGTGPRHPQDWHRDGGSRYGPEVNYLQVFYYPQDVPPEMGPTELLPGSHFLYQREKHMAHYDAVKGSVLTAAPAGSIFLTSYNIWHRRGARTAPESAGIRNLLKYNYWRTEDPQRDWVQEPDFDIEFADFVVDSLRHSELMRDCVDAAEMYFWLCGKSDEFRYLGGQGWPGDIPENKATPEAIARTRYRHRYGVPGDMTDRGGRRAARIW